MSSLFSCDVLKYDADNLRHQAASITMLADSLSEEKKELRQSLDGLQRDWQTDSGREFFDQVDTTWIAQVDDYVGLLRELSQSLERAAAQYDGIRMERATGIFGG